MDSRREFGEIIRHQEEHGNEWRVLAEGLGRARVHVKDAWRRIKLRHQRKGHWSQDEYQKLFNLVNVDLPRRKFSRRRDQSTGCCGTISVGRQLVMSCLLDLMRIAAKSGIIS
ncbi:hypothetical protein CASFOL_001164 [Castilleja foliolosa]|uniref:Myb-like domain-containing protein n=1 Tax=Castilleja foliolosa TaxID=1961234 RepID=A0ABD3ELT0_9LAMI